MRKKVYQLSSLNCYPCQVLKKKFIELNDDSFDYEYINLIDIEPETVPFAILMEARRNRMSSIPIIGVTTLKGDEEVLEILTQLNHNYLKEFIEILKQEKIEESIKSNNE